MFEWFCLFLGEKKSCGGRRVQEVTRRILWRKQDSHVLEKKNPGQKGRRLKGRPTLYREDVASATDKTTLFAVRPAQRVTRGRNIFPPSVLEPIFRTPKTRPPKPPTPETSTRLVTWERHHHLWFDLAKQSISIRRVRILSWKLNSNWYCRLPIESEKSVDIFWNTRCGQNREGGELQRFRITTDWWMLLFFLVGRPRVFPQNKKPLLQFKNRRWWESREKYLSVNQETRGSRFL